MSFWQGRNCSLWINLKGKKHYEISSKAENSLKMYKIAAEEKMTRIRAPYTNVIYSYEVLDTLLIPF